MQSALTVRDLLLPGEPLDPSEVVAGEGGLSNPVSWVVSLRPFPPAFPRLKGGEIALIATEHLSRLDPPVTLVEAMRYLVQRGASAVVVRGDIGEDAAFFARESSMPLLHLLTDLPLQDIEQAIMRECALHQARREVLPQERTTWVADLLAGRVDSLHEAQTLARKEGHTLATHYNVAYLAQPEHGGQEVTAHTLEEAFRKGCKPGLPTPLVAPHEQGVAVLLPQGWDAQKFISLLAGEVPCGFGEEKPVLEAPASLAEAELAALASGLLYGGAPTFYADLRADRLLLLLYRDQPSELRAFVEETLGPLVRHDARSATPLLPTVEAFTRHGGRLRETAAEIYVHRNTLAYRLDRAAEILGVDLKEPAVRLAIELALKARPLVRELPAKS